jgi:hypothetical protein
MISSLEIEEDGLGDLDLSSRVGTLPYSGWFVWGKVRLALRNV